jgi:hypothetical protein
MLSPEKILLIITKIVNGDYTASQLQNLYNNAIKTGHSTITEAARDALVIKGSPEMKRKFLAPIQEHIKNLAYEIAEQHGWLSFPNNRVGNGIKVGGDVMKGALAQYYFSCRLDGWKKAVAFGVTQEDIKSEIYYSVYSPGLMEGLHFQNIDDALALFNSELAKQMA